MTNNNNPLQTMRPLFAALLLAAAPLAAQTASPVVPGAGDILRQMAPLTAPAPSPSGTGLTIKPTEATGLPPSASFLVQSIQITGNTLFDTAALHAVVADEQGQSLTLAQLGELAARITSYYQNNDYPLARAIISAQTIASGIVRIEVIEASYGKISLDNRSRVNDALLQAILAPLQSGQVIAQGGLDDALLLVSDIAGVVTSAILKPGEVVGTSDLLVNTTPGPAVTGNRVLDNNGDQYTGRARISGTVNVINPLQRGDVLSVSGLSSGSGLNYGRLGYETLLKGRGTRVGGAYSALRYALGEPLVALKANGSARVASLWAKHPAAAQPRYQSLRAAPV